jgi:hypothetical protein
MVSVEMKQLAQNWAVNSSAANACFLGSGSRVHRNYGLHLLPTNCIFFQITGQKIASLTAFDT